MVLRLLDGSECASASLVSFELLGGPQKEKIFCYATGFDTDWYKELRFKATRLFTPYGPEEGLEGIRKNEE